MAEYLKLKKVQDWGAEAFAKISSNIAKDEVGLKLDAGQSPTYFSEITHCSVTKPIVGVFQVFKIRSTPSRACWNSSNCVLNTWIELSATNAWENSTV